MSFFAITFKLSVFPINSSKVTKRRGVDLDELLKLTRYGTGWVPGIA